MEVFIVPADELSVNWSIAEETAENCAAKRNSIRVQRKRILKLSRERVLGSWVDQHLAKARGVVASGGRLRSGLGVVG